MFALGLLLSAVSALQVVGEADKTKAAYGQLQNSPEMKKCLKLAKEHGTMFIRAIYDDISEESWGPYVMFGVSSLLMGLLFCVTGKALKLVIKTAISWAVLTFLVLSISPLRMAVGNYLVANA